MAKAQIDDFGEKIGGAKKDMYDSDAMKDGSQYKKELIPPFDYKAIAEKANKLWLAQRKAYDESADKQDFDDFDQLTRQLLGNGKDRPDSVAGGTLALWVKQVRDSIPTPSSGWTEEKLQLYRDTVLKIREGLSNIEKMGDQENLIDKVFGEGLVKVTPFYIKVNKDHPNAAAFELMGHTFYKRCVTSIASYAAKCYNTGFMQDEDNKSERAKHSKADRARVKCYITDRKNKLYTFVYEYNKHYKVVYSEQTLSSQQKARDYLAEHRDAIIEKGKAEVKQFKQMCKRSPCETLERDGDDWRKGMSVHASQVQNSFALRGAEFGNWLPQAERQGQLDWFYDSMSDMAKVLNLPRKAMAHNGRLAIAFGARGGGRFLAHYEPARNVINLTRRGGAGALAHEWFHSLDYFIASQFDSPGLQHQPKAFTRLWTPDFQLAEDKQTPLYKSFMGLVSCVTGDYKNPTQFAINGKKLDGMTSRSYWGTPIELLARAFEAYIEDSLENTYLSAGTKNSGLSKLGGYPEGMERKVMNKAFGDFFKEMRLELMNAMGLEDEPDEEMELTTPRMDIGGSTQPVKKPQQNVQKGHTFSMF